MDVAHEIERFLRLFAGRRDQLDQRLGLIGGDPGVCECRSQGGWMGGLGDQPVGREAKTLFLKPLESATDKPLLS
jgi:hypothetical protein